MTFLLFHRNSVFFYSFFLELRTAFILMDSDGDGRVTAAEVQSMLQRLGIHLREEVVVNLVRQASQSGEKMEEKKTTTTTLWIKVKGRRTKQEGKVAKQSQRGAVRELSRPTL